MNQQNNSSTDQSSIEPSNNKDSQQLKVRSEGIQVLQSENVADKKKEGSFEDENSQTLMELKKKVALAKQEKEEKDRIYQNVLKEQEDFLSQISEEKDKPQKDDEKSKGIRNSLTNLQHNHQYLPNSEDQSFKPSSQSRSVDDSLFYKSSDFSSQNKLQDFNLNEGSYYPDQNLQHNHQKSYKSQEQSVQLGFSVLKSSDSSNWFKILDEGSLTPNGTIPQQGTEGQDHIQPTEGTQPIEGLIENVEEQ